MRKMKGNSFGCEYSSAESGTGGWARMVAATPAREKDTT